VKVIVAGFIATVAVVPSLAWADQAEYRIGAGGGLTLVDAHVGGAGGVGTGYEARARLGYGLSNTFELGLVGAYSHSSDIAVDDATVEGQTGKLYTNMSTVSLAAELRWTPGVSVARAFERTGPYLAVRAGGALVVRTSQQLFMEGSLLLVSPTDDVR